MSFKAAEDLQTLLNTEFDHDNVAGISAKPTIKLQSSAEPTTYPVSGEVIIKSEDLTGIDDRAAFADENYQVRVIVKFDSTTSVIIKLIAAEIWRIMRVVNKSANRAYFYKIDYSWVGGVLNGRVDLSVQMRRELVAQ